MVHQQATYTLLLGKTDHEAEIARAMHGIVQIITQYQEQKSLIGRVYA